MSEFNSFMIGDSVEVAGKLLSIDNDNVVLCVDRANCRILNKICPEGKFVALLPGQDDDSKCLENFAANTVFLVKSRSRFVLHVETADKQEKKLYLRRFRYASESEIAEFQVTRAKKDEQERVQKEQEEKQRKCEEWKKTIANCSLQEAITFMELAQSRCAALCKAGHNAEKDQSAEKAVTIDNDKNEKLDAAVGAATDTKTENEKTQTSLSE